MQLALSDQFQFGKSSDFANLNELSSFHFDFFFSIAAKWAKSRISSPISHTINDSHHHHRHLERLFQLFQHIDTPAGLRFGSSSPSDTERAGKQKVMIFRYSSAFHHEGGCSRGEGMDHGNTSLSPGRCRHEWAIGTWPGLGGGWCHGFTSTLFLWFWR